METSSKLVSWRAFYNQTQIDLERMGMNEWDICVALTILRDLRRTIVKRVSTGGGAIYTEDLMLVAEIYAVRFEYADIGLIMNTLLDRECFSDGLPRLILYNDDFGIRIRTMQATLPMPLFPAFQGMSRIIYRWKLQKTQRELYAKLFDNPLGPTEQTS